MSRNKRALLFLEFRISDERKVAVQNRNFSKLKSPCEAGKYRDLANLMEWLTMKFYVILNYRNNNLLYLINFEISKKVSYQFDYYSRICSIVSKRENIHR